MEQVLVLFLGLVAYGCMGRAVVGPVRGMVEAADKVCERSLEVDEIRVTQPVGYDAIVVVAYMLILAIWPLRVITWLYKCARWVVRKYQS